jgi:hypothetical protein
MPLRLDTAHSSFIVDNSDGPLAKRYPPGSTFHCSTERVDLNYDHASAGWRVTQHVRITGVTGPDGTVIPYPSEDAPDDRDRQLFYPDPAITGKRWDE